MPNFCQFDPERGRKRFPVATCKTLFMTPCCCPPEEVQVVVRRKVSLIKYTHTRTQNQVASTGRTCCLIKTALWESGGLEGNSKDKREHTHTHTQTRTTGTNRGNLPWENTSQVESTERMGKRTRRKRWREISLFLLRGSCHLQQFLSALTQPGADSSWQCVSVCVFVCYT